MKEIYVDLINIRRKVFAEIARMAYDDIDLKEIEKIPYKIIPGEVAKYRENIFRERAIIEERLRLTLGLNVRNLGEFTKVTEGIESINVDEIVFVPPLVNVITFACEACPERAFVVTDNCRKCLAHPCTNVCPVNAISIGKNRAIINKEKCIKCGKCKESCPYSAIVEYHRPCSQVCGVNAIESDELGRAKINEEKCVSCGRCITQCPFGAIADKTQIYQLIKALKSNDNMYAIIAPSFVGQFGVLASPAQVFEGAVRVGMADIRAGKPQGRPLPGCRTRGWPLSDPPLRHPVRQAPSPGSLLDVGTHLPDGRQVRVPGAESSHGVQPGHPERPC